MKGKRGGEEEEEEQKKGNERDGTSEKKEQDQPIHRETEREREKALLQPLPYARMESRNAWVGAYARIVHVTECQGRIVL